MRAHGKTRGWWLTASALALAAGCAGRVPPQVARVASHDLNCEHVEIAELADDRFAASGCGRGAVYAELCLESGCRWGRLRHGHEQNIAYGQPQPQGERQVLPAPPPAQREVLPAPQPQPREVIPAPPPSSSSSTSGGASSPSDAAGQPGAQAPTNVTPAPASAMPADSPLQPGAAAATLPQGELSAPYETQVPLQPVAQQVTEAPPAPLVETRPPPPARNYVWISGWWWWGPGASWVWAPGYWGPSYYGYSYVPGSWYWSSGYWWYGPGGWARPGTTIIINRQLPPRASHTAVVRSFRPYRVGPSVQSGGVHRVVQAPRGGFAPRGSPLNTTPSTRVVRPAPSTGGRYYSPSYSGGAPSTSRYGAPGVGRVVSPDSAVRPRSSYGSGGVAPRSYSGGSSYSGGGGGSYSAPRSGGGGSYSAPRSGGGGSYSAPRGGGGGSYSAPRGGGGGSYSAPRGGGGGGARVSPGGGGGGGRRR
jgi:hypothetical protein